MNKHIIVASLCITTSLQSAEHGKIVPFYTEKSLTHPIACTAQETIISFMKKTFPTVKKEYLKVECLSKPDEKRFEIIQYNPQTTISLKSIFVMHPLIEYVPSELHQLSFMEFEKEIKKNPDLDRLMAEIMATMLYTLKK